MSEEPELVEFKRLMGEVRDLAAKTERQRCVLVATRHRAPDGTYPRTAALIAGKLLNLGLSADTSPPPAPEPMTVEGLLGKLRMNGDLVYQDTTSLKADLQALVKEQARKDAAILSQREREHPPGWSKELRTGWTAACRDGQARIRNAAAGLE